MTNAEELSLLETAYSALLTGGMEEYTISENGTSRTFRKIGMKAMAERIDQLRLAVARSGGGIFVASQFRRAE